MPTPKGVQLQRIEGLTMGEYTKRAPDGLAALGHAIRQVQEISGQRFFTCHPFTLWDRRR
jgi:hypothetical protein